MPGGNAKDLISFCMYQTGEECWNVLKCSLCFEMSKKVGLWFDFLYSKMSAQGQRDSILFWTVFYMSSVPPWLIFFNVVFILAFGDSQPELIFQDSRDTGAVGAGFKYRLCFGISKS